MYTKKGRPGFLRVFRNWKPYTYLGKFMTCCIAAICDDGKNIVLVADKMIGIGFIESEPDINKLLQLHKNWWVLFAGEDISPVFDIVDYAKRHIRDALTKAKANLDEPIDLQLAMDAIRESYDKKKIEEAETLYLKPIGWDIASFNAGGKTNLPDFGEIKARIADYAFNIELLVAGFSGGKGYVFALYGSGPEKGLIKRHDVPGFYAIGSGRSWAFPLTGQPGGPHEGFNFNHHVSPS